MQGTLASLLDPTVSLSRMVLNYVHETSKLFQDLQESLASSGKPISIKRAELHRFAKSRHNQLSRILMLVKWACERNEDVPRLAKLHEALDLRGRHFTVADQSLQANAIHMQTNGLYPMWDVHTAMHVLTVGSYKLLPKRIEHDAQLQPEMSPEKRAMVIQRLNTKLHLHLLQTAVPPQFSSISVKDGMAHMTVPGLFTAVVSLRMLPSDPQEQGGQEEIQSPSQQQANGYALKRLKSESYDMKTDSRSETSERERREEELERRKREMERIYWHLFELRVHLKLAVASEEEEETSESLTLVSSAQCQRLANILNGFMRRQDCEAPLAVLYQRVHSFCSAVQLEVLHRQSSSSSIQSLFGSPIRVEYDTRRELRIFYWLDVKPVFAVGQLFGVKTGTKPSAAPSEGACLRIALDRMGYLRLRHDPPLEDERWSDLFVRALDPSNISLSRIVQAAISAHCRLRLSQLATYLSKIDGERDPEKETDNGGEEAVEQARLAYHRYELKEVKNPDFGSGNEGSDYVLELELVAPFAVPSISSAREVVVKTSRHTGTLTLRWKGWSAPVGSRAAQLLQESEKALSTSPGVFLKSLTRLQRWTLTQYVLGLTRSCGLTTVWDPPVSVVEVSTVVNRLFILAPRFDGFYLVLDTNLRAGTRLASSNPDSSSSRVHCFAFEQDPKGGLIQVIRRTYQDILVKGETDGDSRTAPAVDDDRVTAAVHALSLSCNSWTADTVNKIVEGAMHVLPLVVLRHEIRSYAIESLPLTAQNSTVIVLAWLFAGDPWIRDETKASAQSARVPSARIQLEQDGSWSSSVDDPSLRDILTWEVLSNSLKVGVRHRMASGGTLELDASGSGVCTYRYSRFDTGSFGTFLRDVRRFSAVIQMASHLRLYQSTPLPPPPADASQSGSTTGISETQQKRLSYLPFSRLPPPTFFQFHSCDPFQGRLVIKYIVQEQQDPREKRQSREARAASPVAAGAVLSDRFINISISEQPGTSVLSGREASLMSLVPAATVEFQPHPLVTEEFITAGFNARRQRGIAERVLSVMRGAAVATAADSAVALASGAPSDLTGDERLADKDALQWLLCRVYWCYRPSRLLQHTCTKVGQISGGLCPNPLQLVAQSAQRIQMCLRPSAVMDIDCYHPNFVDLRMYPNNEVRLTYARADHLDFVGKIADWMKQAGRETVMRWCTNESKESRTMSWQYQVVKQALQITAEFKSEEFRNLLGGSDVSVWIQKYLAQKKFVPYRMPLLMEVGALTRWPLPEAARPFISLMFLELTVLAEYKTTKKDARFIEFQLGLDCSPHPTLHFDQEAGLVSFTVFFLGPVAEGDERGVLPVYLEWSIKGRAVHLVSQEQDQSKRIRSRMPLPLGPETQPREHVVVSTMKRIRQDATSLRAISESLSQLW